MKKECKPQKRRSNLGVLFSNCLMDVEIVLKINIINILSKYINMKKLIYFIIACLIISCTKKDDTKFTGSVSGRVSLYDTKRTQLSDLNGISIKLLQENKTIEKTITDNDGSFTFKNMPEGVLNLVFHKDNFGGCDTLEFTNNDEDITLENITLFEYPPVTITLNEVQFDGTYVNITYGIEFNSVNRFSCSTEYFLSTNPNVSYNNYQFRFFEGGSTTASSDMHYTCGLEMTRQYYYDAGFKRGDRVYLVLYPTNADFESFYELINKTLTVKAHVRKNPSNIVSFIMP